MVRIDELVYLLMAGLASGCSDTSLAGQVVVPDGAPLDSVHPDTVHVPDATDVLDTFSDTSPDLVVDPPLDTGWDAPWDAPWDAITEPWPDTGPCTWRAGTERRLTTSAAESFHPDLVFTGSQLAVAWQDFRTGIPEVWFERLTLAGESLGGPQRVRTDGVPSGLSSMVWTGSELVLAWHENDSGDNQIHLVRLSPAGVISGDVVQLTSGSHAFHSPTLAWSGSEIGVLYCDIDPASSHADLVFDRRSLDGTSLSASFVLHHGHLADCSLSALTWIAGGYVATWTDGSLINTVRISAAGEPLTDPVKVVEGHVDSLTALSIDTHITVIWGRDFPDPEKIYLHVAMPDLSSVSGAAPVTSGAYPATCPSGAWSGLVLGIAWTDGRDDPSAPDIYFGGLTAEASVAVPIMPASSTSAFARFSSTAWAGDAFAIVWEDLRHGDAELYFNTVSCTP